MELVAGAKEMTKFPAILFIALLVLVLQADASRKARRQRNRSNNVESPEQMKESGPQEAKLEPSINWSWEANKMRAFPAFIDAVVQEARDMHILEADFLPNLLQMTEEAAKPYCMQLFRGKLVRDGPYVHRLTILGPGNNPDGYWKAILTCSEEAYYLEAELSHDLWNGYTRIKTPGNSFRDSVIDLGARR